MTWHLDNGEQRHAENPDTFEIPSDRERKSLKPGQFAKMIFLVGDQGERMWVKVQEVQPDGWYSGTLANTPAFIKGLTFGDTVQFKPEHVISIETKAH